MSHVMFYLRHMIWRKWNNRRIQCLKKELREQTEPVARPMHSNSHERNVKERKPMWYELRYCSEVSPDGSVQLTWLTHVTGIRT